MVHCVVPTMKKRWTAHRQMVHMRKELWPIVLCPLCNYAKKKGGVWRTHRTPKRRMLFEIFLDQGNCYAFGWIGNRKEEK
jgi:hypothetical protein